jgi:hypothetical protein
MKRMSEGKKTNDKNDRMIEGKEEVGIEERKRAGNINREK